MLSTGIQPVTVTVAVAVTVAIVANMCTKYRTAELEAAPISAAGLHHGTQPGS